MSFIPENFSPPCHVCLPGMQLQVLGPDLADADFAAVCRSAERIRHVFGPDNDWPAADIPFAANLADLQRHEDEFRQRAAFAYALLSADGADYLGCLYLRPVKSRLENDTRRVVFQAQAFVWLSEIAIHAEESILRTLQAWLAKDWPWRSLAWPGRQQPWPLWQAMARMEVSDIC